MTDADVLVAGGDTEPGVLIRSLNGRIAFWSPEMERRYGFPPDEAHGKLSHELLRTSFWQTRDQIQAILVDQHTWAGGLILHQADGRPIIAANYWHLLDDPGGGVPFVAELHSDIVPTGAADGIELADIMATVAQELSQPMAALSAYLNGMQKILLRPWPNKAQLQSATDAALREIERGSNILQRIRAIGEQMRSPRSRGLHARLTAAAQQTTALRETAKQAVQRALTVQSIMILQRLLKQEWLGSAGERVGAPLTLLLADQERRLATFDNPR